MVSAGRRPVIGVLCCNEHVARPVQVVASRFIEPLTTLAGATVLLVPALMTTDAAAVTQVLDGLLLTGSRSNVAAHRYGAGCNAREETVDEARDEVALSLAGRMIESGKPVFGICRGLQEINVLFGGTLSTELDTPHHHRGSWDGDYEGLFAHSHDVTLLEQGRLHAATGAPRLKVNSVHEQGIDRLGTGLSVEAVACDDNLIEAVSAHPCGADVLAVQWHPEWDFRTARASRAFFAIVGAALRNDPVGDFGPVPAAYPLNGGVVRGH